MPDEGLDATVDSSTTTIEPEVTPDTTPDTTQEPTSEPTPEEDVPFHQHPRWQQVQAELKAYKALGDPRTLQTQVEQLRQYEARLLQQWQAQQATRQQGRPPMQQYPQLTQEEVEARNFVHRVMPELGALMQQSQGLAQQVQMQQETTINRGQTLVGKFTKEHLGTEAPMAQMAIENAATALIAADPRALQRFRAGDLSVVEEALDLFKVSVLDPIRRGAVSNYTKQKTKVGNLPATSVAGGRGTPGGVSKTEGEDTPDSRAKRGFELLERLSKK